MARVIPRSHDVARIAGVSRTTVSYVLNGRADVSIPEETRRRVLSAAEEIGYRANRAARALTTGQTQVVGLWVSRFDRPHYAAALHRAWGQARRHGFEIIMGDLSMPQYSPTESSWPVDGILVCDYPEHIEAFLDLYPGSQTPFVNMGGVICPRVDYVEVDLAAGTREAVRHLVDQGCRRIAYLVQEWGNRPGEVRYDAYHDILRDAGLTPEIIPVAETDRNLARTAIRARFASEDRPDGLFCFNDDLALGAYRGLLDLGLRIPRDVALVGCDGIDDVEYLETPLTTIVQPLTEMCDLGWDYLHRRIAAPETPRQQTTLQPTLRIRASSVRRPG